MKTATKVVLASALVLWAIVPVLAAEEDTLLERNLFFSATVPTVKRAMVIVSHANQALTARAYAPIDSPAAGYPKFDIGSQR